MKKIKNNFTSMVGILLIVFLLLVVVNQMK